jgi:hypothetical protein
MKLPIEKFLKLIGFWRSRGFVVDRLISGRLILKNIAPAKRVNGEVYIGG